MTAADSPLLVVDGLSVEFATKSGPVRVVEGVSFEVRAGETLGLVGESGCGKSVSSLSIMGLLPRRQARIAEGKIFFDGRDITALRDAERRKINGSQISMIFQEPMTSLNPSFTIGNQIIEGLRAHNDISKRAARDLAAEMLDLVGIPDAYKRLRSYPYEYSGGMRQRAMIAMALVNRPNLLIADEPTTALDVTVQAQILEVLRKLQRELGMAVIFITHDLGVVADICDRVVVMYAGQVVETAHVDDLFERPLHPYTEGLLHSMPQNALRADYLHVIAGTVPRPGEMPEGCRFAPRCDYVTDECAVHVQLTGVGDEGSNRASRCVRVTELALEGAK